MRTPLRGILLFLAASLLPGGAAHAGCGLSFCPRPERPGEKHLELGFMAKHTAFDIQGTEGAYQELMASVQYTAFGRLALGLHAPFIVLDAGTTEAGMGNLVAYAEWRARPEWLNAFGAGVQLEIPMGGSDRGLGDDHWMMVPYLTLARHLGPLMLGGGLGVAFTVYGAHAEEAHAHHAGRESVPVYVHPHEHSELLYRVSAGAPMADMRFLPEIFLDGQQVLGHTEVEGADISFLNAGLSLPRVWGSLTIASHAAFPLLGERFAWTAGVTLAWKLGLGGRPPPTGET